MEERSEGPESLERRVSWRPGAEGAECVEVESLVAEVRLVVWEAWAEAGVMRMLEDWGWVSFGRKGEREKEGEGRTILRDASGCLCKGSGLGCGGGY